MSSFSRLARLAHRQGSLLSVCARSISGGSKKLSDGPTLQKAFLRSVKPSPKKKNADVEAIVDETAPIVDEKIPEAKTQDILSIDSDVKPFVKNDKDLASETARQFLSSNALQASVNLQEFAPRICVVGVGGGGSNAINNMVARGLSGVEFICTNTDAQHLSTTLTEKRIQLGRGLTEGLGCGKYNREMSSSSVVRHLASPHPSSFCHHH